MPPVNYRDPIQAWPYLLPGWPAHRDNNYAFKAYALDFAAKWCGPGSLLLWCDASIVPIKPLDAVFAEIEERGVWLPANHFEPKSNYHWTAESAYADLLPYGPVAQLINRNIPHCATTAFGISTGHPAGKAFLKQFFRLASQTKAFHGPWINANCPEQMASRNVTEADGFICAPCGPPEVRGHRHDQTVASVLAHSLHIELDHQGLLAYKGLETEKTVLVADGGYE